MNESKEFLRDEPLSTVLNILERVTNTLQSQLVANVSPHHPTENVVQYSKSDVPELFDEVRRRTANLSEPIPDILDSRKWSEWYRDAKSVSLKDAREECHRRWDLYVAVDRSLDVRAAEVRAFALKLKERDYVG